MAKRFQLIDTRTGGKIDKLRSRKDAERLCGVLNSIADAFGKAAYVEIVEIKP